MNFRNSALEWCRPSALAEIPSPYSIYLCAICSLFLDVNKCTDLECVHNECVPRCHQSVFSRRTPLLHIHVVGVTHHLGRETIMYGKATVCHARPASKRSLWRTAHHNQNWPIGKLRGHAVAVVHEAGSTIFLHFRDLRTLIKSFRVIKAYDR